MIKGKVKDEFWWEKELFKDDTQRGNQYGKSVIDGIFFCSL